MKKILLSLALLLSLSSITLGQNLFPLLGGQRVGTAVASFLKIDMGAEAAAMGGAYVAMASDATTLFWNPAAAVQVPGNSMTLSHIQYPVDIQYEYLGYIHHFWRYMGIGCQPGHVTHAGYGSYH